MPKQYEDLGIRVLFPDNWTVDDQSESDSVTIESPTGAFLTVSRFEGPPVGSDSVIPDSPLEQAKTAMEEEYDEVEQEVLQKSILGNELTGVTQRFVYLDLIVTSHLLMLPGNECNYLIQFQAEDREMEKLNPVFDAMLTSICQPPPERTDAGEAVSSQRPPR